MTDREKVIEELERLSEWLFNQYRVVYDGDAPNYYDAYKTVDDALTLLKEQPEIVRCKDCKYCEFPNATREWCKKGHLHGNAQTWFCADGKGAEV